MPQDKPQIVIAYPTLRDPADMIFGRQGHLVVIASHSEHLTLQQAYERGLIGDEGEQD